MFKSDLKYSIESLNNFLFKNKKEIVENVYAEFKGDWDKIEDYIFAVEIFREDFLEHFVKQKK